jgi:hypothetical protein
MSPREVVNGLTALGLVFVLGLAARGYSASHGTALIAPSPTTAKPAVPAPQPVSKETGRRVVASAKIVNDRCNLPGFAGQGSGRNAAFTFEIDTGDPSIADFSNRWVAKLGLNPATLDYREVEPGTRYGKIAYATLPEIRIGDMVWKNEQVGIWDRWSYSFGHEEIPLFGLVALQKRGVRLEVEGDTCRLTVARKAIG